jgi:hypothetical protein
MAIEKIPTKGNSNAAHVPITGKLLSIILVQAEKNSKVSKNGKKIKSKGPTPAELSIVQIICG